MIAFAINLSPTPYDCSADWPGEAFAALQHFFRFGQ
jgi:hypothetical protein